MASKRAGDIMIPIEDYPHVPHTLSIRRTAVVMEKSYIEVEGRRSLPRALLVVDDECNPIGCVRRRDILRGIEPQFLKTASVPERKRLFEIEIDPNLVDMLSGRMGKAIQEQSKRPVTDIMQPIKATVEHDDHLAKVVFKMVSLDLNLLLVLKDSQVVGVIRSVGIFREIVSQLYLTE
ncbi:MAG: hypothetical protein DRP45_09375 [Candidatus Zixiibacteriota bacterium]|nr:MAG: hypothetical protein DRP45_09375 [candidate division Zixibacteria bacterium]